MEVIETKKVEICTKRYKICMKKCEICKKKKYLLIYHKFITYLLIYTKQKSKHLYLKKLYY